MGAAFERRQDRHAVNSKLILASALLELRVLHRKDDGGTNPLPQTLDDGDNGDDGRELVTHQAHFQPQAKTSKQATKVSIKPSSPRSAPRPILPLHAAKRGKQAHRREIETRSPTQRAKVGRGSVSRIQANSVAGGIAADGLGRGSKQTALTAWYPTSPRLSTCDKRTRVSSLWRLALSQSRYA